MFLMLLDYRHSKKPLPRKIVGFFLRNDRKLEFRSPYAAGSCIAYKHAHSISRCGLRKCRYIGEAKDHSQHPLTTAAISEINADERCGKAV